jgi:phospholipase C
MSALVLGCAGASPDSATRGLVGQHAASPLRTVFLILMENHNWSDIAFNPSASYINETLLPLGALTDNYVGDRHPSLPNYLWLEAGDDLGVSDDGPPSEHHQGTSDHLVNYLERAGVTWKAYQEDIDGGSCPLGDSGRYAVRHDPFVYFDDVTNNQDPHAPRCIQHIRPYSELAGDLQGGNVANYNFITPNVCDDMHDDCSGDSIKQGNDWLAREVPRIISSQAYQNGGAILITWDESEGGCDPNACTIGMLVVSPLAQRGLISHQRFDHSSTLRTLQTVFGAGPLLRNAPVAGDLSPLFSVPIAPMQ